MARSVAVIGSTGKAGCQHVAAFLAQGWHVLPVNKGDKIPLDAVDAVSVCTPDGLHAEMVLAALAAEKHVFCEKPLCLTRMEIDSIVDAYNATPAGVILTCNFPLRSVPEFKALRVPLSKGWFGRQVYIELEYLKDMGDRLSTGWRAETYGYSPMLAGGIHMVDLVCWMVGGYPGAKHYIAPSTKTTECVGMTFSEQLHVRVTTCLERGTVSMHSIKVFGSKHDYFSFQHQQPGIGALIPNFVGAIEGREPLIVQAEEAINATAVCLKDDEILPPGTHTARH